MVNFHIYFLQNVNAVDMLGPLFKNKMKTIQKTVKSKIIADFAYLVKARLKPTVSFCLKQATK